MSSRVAPDDLDLGMFVTIHSELVREPEAGLDEYFPGMKAPRSNGDSLPAPLGVPLQVQGISFPFILCGVLSPGGEIGGPIVVDLRSVQLCKLAENYIKAIATFPVVKKPSSDGTEGNKIDNS